MIELRVSVSFSNTQNLSPKIMTQAQLDFHTMTSQVTQDQIDFQNQLEMHTADLVTKPLLLLNQMIQLFSFLILKKRLTILFLNKWNIKISFQKLKRFGS